jgi:pilus assembly protein Flp/PilA
MALYTKCIINNSRCSQMRTHDNVMGDLSLAYNERYTTSDTSCVWSRTCISLGVPEPAGTHLDREDMQMNNLFLKLLVKIQTLAMREEGQDLVEYALVVGLISVAAVAALKNAATAVNSVVGNITGTLNNAV